MTSALKMADDSKDPEDSSTSTSTAIQPASFSSLFKYADSSDIFIFCVGVFFSILAGAVLPAINIVFGELIDAIAEPTNTSKLLNSAIIGMLVLGAVGFVTFFLGFFCTGWSAARIANKFRVRYLEAVLRQDATYFDHAEPGSVALALSDSAMDIQTGLADKFAQSVQGVSSFLFGFVVAFYFGVMLTLVLLSCLPILIGITYAMTTWGSEDGFYGKEAYESAASVASETLSNMRTVMSLNAETNRSQKYDKNLAISERAAIKQGTIQASLMGGLMMVMFCMYGLGFWYGGKMIADSTDNAIEAFPAPEGLVYGLDPWEDHYGIIMQVCAQYAGMALEICACGIPWDSMGMTNPSCGCGAYAEAAGGISLNDGCFTGGKTIMVFFSVLIGGFGIGTMGPGVQALATARIAAAKMMLVINREPTININAKGKKSLGTDVAGEITLENLHFGYPSKDEGSDPTPVFGGCNLTMTAGHTVALVGESGCGKSTIAKLMQRFYDPTSGRILLDDVDLTDISLRDLRRNIGVVSQEPLLFDCSVLENIRYGKPEASDEEVFEAANNANAHEFITKFPEGYRTVVGPRGGKLSGGQKQRVAIARAILRNPPILILDEATSALDRQSEVIVQKALDRLIEHKDNKQARTTIVIAHRLTTIRNADKIVMLGSPEGTSTALQGSVILEEGSHDELMAIEGGFYKALVGVGEKGSGKDKARELERQESAIRVTGNHASFRKMLNDKLKIEEVIEKPKTDWKKMFAKKDIKQQMEQKAYKEQKSRVWNYTRPDLPWIIFGSVASIIKGMLLPLISVVFAEMITLWYVSDTDRMREGSLNWSYLFYILAVVNLLTETAQKGVFEMVGERLTRRIRSDLFRGILRQDVAWFEAEENSQGILMSQLSTDVKRVRLVAGQGVAVTLETVAALTTGIVIALTASWEMFLIMLAMVPLLGATEAMQWKALAGSEGKIKEELTKSTNKLNETVNGIREVQAFALERIVADDIQKRIMETIVPASTLAALTKGVMMGMIQLITFWVYAFAFWFGGEMIVKGRITFEDFNKALWAMAFAASGLGAAAVFAGDGPKAATAVKIIFGTLDRMPVIDSKPWEDNQANSKPRIPTVRALSDTPMTEGRAELHDVDFAYPTRKMAKVFNKITLTVPAGKSVALVGSSGSGKSTVVQLLERFYDPIRYSETKGEKGKEATIEIVVHDGTENGTVRLDGKDMRQLDCRWVRKHMALVGQEPVLFNDTIYNNIALGKEGCTKEEVEEAAKSANAYNFIMDLGEKFQTNVGTSGGKVSGGQKQRIAIARALISDPKILLLDEATSALDNESEKIVQASLDALVEEGGGNRTTLIIAHRLSTIRGADVICVLENDGEGSKVCEQGTHEELMVLGNKYKALVEAYEK